MFKKLSILIVICFSSTGFTQVETDNPFDRTPYLQFDELEIINNTVVNMLNIGLDYSECLDYNTMFFSITNAIDQSWDFDSFVGHFEIMLKTSREPKTLISDAVCDETAKKAWEYLSTPVNISKTLGNFISGSFTGSDPDGSVRAGPLLKYTQVGELKFLLIGALMVGIGDHDCVVERRKILNVTLEKSVGLLHPFRGIDYGDFEKYNDAISPLIEYCNDKIKSKHNWNFGADLTQEGSTAFKGHAGKTWNLE